MLLIGIHGESAPLLSTLTRQVAEERMEGPTYPSAVFADPAEEICTEKIHGPPQDVPHGLREMRLHHLRRKQNTRRSSDVAFSIISTFLAAPVQDLP